MANTLLPTVGLKLQSENGNFGSQYRTKASNVYTGVNTNLPFMNKPAEQMKYANAFAELADNFAQRIIDRKKETLYNQAQNEMITKLSERENQYKALKGQDAIDGFAKYQEDITKIKSDYDQVFENHPVESHKFKLNSNEFATRYGIEGKNYHDTEVIKQADNELNALFSNNMSEWFKHFNSPQENLFKQQAFDTLDQIADKSGIVKGSEAYNQQVAKMFDTYATSTIQYQVANKNYNGALVTLNKSKDSMNGDTYLKLLGGIQSAQKTEAERQASRAEARALLSANKAFEGMKPVEKAEFIKRLKVELKEEHPEWSDEKIATQAIFECVQEEQFRHSLANVDSMVFGSIKSTFQQAILNGEKVDYKNPLSLFPPEQKDIILRQFDYDEEKAIKTCQNIFSSVEQISKKIDTGAGKQLMGMFKHDPNGATAEIPDYVALDNFLIKHPQTTRDEIEIRTQYAQLYRENIQGKGLSETPFYKEGLSQVLARFDLPTDYKKDSPEEAWRRGFVVTEYNKAINETKQEQIKNPAKFQNAMSFSVGVMSRFNDTIIRHGDIKEKARESYDKINDIASSILNTLEEEGAILYDKERLTEVARTFIMKDFSENDNKFNSDIYYLNKIKPILLGLPANNPNEKEPVFTEEQQLRTKAINDVSIFKNKDSLNDYESTLLKLANRFLKGEISKEEYENERKKISREKIKSETTLYETHI